MQDVTQTNSRDHCHAGLDYTALTAMRNVLLQCWYSRDHSPISKKDNYLSELATKAGCDTKSFLCWVPVHVHFGQWQKLHCPQTHCHTGVGITPIPYHLLMQWGTCFTWFVSPWPGTWFHLKWGKNTCYAFTLPKRPRNYCFIYLPKYNSYIRLNKISLLITMINK